MRRRALLIGGLGQLGSELRRQGEGAWDITAPGRSELDAFDPDALARAVEALHSSRQAAQTDDRVRESLSGAGSPFPYVSIDLRRFSTNSEKYHSGLQNGTNSLRQIP
jgi:hypothetical protein